MNRWAATAFCMIMMASFAYGGAVDLRCDQRVNPLAVHTPAPLLSWKIKDARPGAVQTAYQILVSSSAEKLAADQGDLWDSGMVESDQCRFIPCRAGKLSPRQTAFWKVRVRDQENVWSGWSDAATWSMGLLVPADWGASEWIGYDGPDTRDPDLSARRTKRKSDPAATLRRSFPSPLLRREFSISRPVRRAVVYISGVGYCELYLNGNRIGDSVLDPGQTSYDKRTLYVAHDVTDAVQVGNNAAGIMLGNGFYGQNIGFIDALAYGLPRVKMRLVIEFADGGETEVLTTADWKAALGPVCFDNVYLGETWDARKEQDGWAQPGFDDRSWIAARSLPAPTDLLQPQIVAPIRKIRSVKPAAVLSAENGDWILDLGQNIGGWLQMHLNEERGREVRLHFAEYLNRKGTAVDDRSTGVEPVCAPQIDVYVCKGGGETWEPRFTYHGFRFVQISGLSQKPDLDDFTGWLVRSDVETAGTFSSSDPQMNRFFHVSKWTLEDNLQGNLTDCPHRERCAWTGDTVATGQFASYGFNLLGFWRNAMDNIETVLGAAGPQPESVIPRDRRAPTNILVGKRLCQQARPDWGSATVLVPWTQYLFYGDLPSIEKHWPVMKGWLEVMEEFAVKDGIISEGYGDWCPPAFKQDTPVALTSTALFYRSLGAMARMGEALGKKKEARQYARRAGEIRKAFNGRFYQTETGSYGSQTGNSVALFYGLAPDEDRQRVADRLAAFVMDDAGGRYTTGIFGHRALYTMLNDYGHRDVTRHLWNRTAWPSLRYITEDRGLTTWPEISVEWGTSGTPPACSANHPMHSGFAAVFFESLGGIRPDPEYPGFKKTVLKPCFMPGVDWVNADYESPYGKISSHWKKSESLITWSFNIPANTSAEVWIPAADTDDIQFGAHQDQVRFLRQTGAYQLFAVSSGEYSVAVGCEL